MSTASKSPALLHQTTKRPLSAIMLLARSETLRPGYRLTVSMEGDGMQR